MPTEESARLGEYMKYEDADEHRGFSTVAKSERKHIEDMFNSRDMSVRPSPQRFSLAFSGGGIRAAAFQSGVLWQLAKMNKLKDIEYFTAVSGGGYITSAFASHIREAEQEGQAPRTPEECRQFYLRAVAKTIVRMQHNAGDFVRDCVADPGEGRFAGNFLSRKWDLLILLVVLFFTLAVNPVFFVMALLVPFTISIELFYGGAMRATFCNLEEFQTMYYTYSNFGSLIQLTMWLMTATFVVFVLKMAIPACNKRRMDPEELGPVEVAQSRQPGYRHLYEATLGYKMGHALSAFMVRYTVICCMLIMFVVCVPFLQYLKTDQAVVSERCQAYVTTMQENPDKHKCSDRLDDDAGEYWFTLNVTQVEGSISQGSPQIQLPEWLPTQDLFKFVLLILFSVLALSLICMPILGTVILKSLISWGGPVVVFLSALVFVQYAVFGPMTKENTLLFLGTYEKDKWETFVSRALMGATLTIPFYEELRSVLHIYYKKCLVQNYFAKGQDFPFVELMKSKFTPFVILTGTSTDFCPPEDERDCISEISFSALHTGSYETGYTHMPHYRTLGKCTALTGAGCLDAISLSMSDAVAMRFWLEVLNLSWGDYIIFESEKDSCKEFTLWVKRMSIAVGERFGAHWEGISNRLMHRMPSGPLWIGFYILVNVSWHYGYSGSTGCDTSTATMQMAIWLLVTLVAVSFFTFAPVLDLLSLSPMLRQLHQATKYFYVGQPPRMLYVTDGGVKDCTALNQLMWRKCERILLVLAAADANDELNVLRTAMQEAVFHQLGSFYDPKDPRKDLKITFDEYKNNPAMPYLHIGIRYGWSDSSKTGHLIIIKNRLPPSEVGKAIRPLLTEQEVMGEEGRGNEEEYDLSPWADLTTDQLGPFGCCDCCHTNGYCGNCGPKFPHGTFTGYMWLTPQWCNSLARLGHDVSGEAIERITSREPLGQKWEYVVGSDSNQSAWSSFLEARSP